MFAPDQSQVSGIGLRTPKAARKEMESLKEKLESLKDFNEQQKFLGKRDRLMRTGWRHGIVGVDDADSGQTQVFYQSTKAEKQHS